MTTRDGTFEGDKDMPRFGLLEGEAAIRYLNVAIEVAKMRKAGMRSVTVEGKEMPMAEAERLKARYHYQFMETVAEETRRADPEASDARIRQRASDILRCHSDTGYISQGYRE